MFRICAFLSCMCFPWPNRELPGLNQLEPPHWNCCPTSMAALVGLSLSLSLSVTLLTPRHLNPMGILDILCVSLHMVLFLLATNLSWRDSNSLLKGLAIMKSQRTNPLSFGNTASCQEHCCHCHCHCHCHCVGVGIPSIYTLGGHQKLPLSFLLLGVWETHLDTFLPNPLW